jgi:hypothetical protein
MSVQPLEATLPFERLLDYARPYVDGRWEVTHWVVHALCHAMGRLSIYDYAARLALAEEQLGRVIPEHTQASKVALRRIIFNLAPQPETVQAAEYGPETAEFETLPDTEGLPALDDAPLGDCQLVRRRQELLKRAFLLYCDVATRALTMDMEDEELPGFGDYYENTVAWVREQVDRLAELRPELFEDFPEEELRSVSDDVVMKRLHTYAIKERLQETAKAQDILDEMNRIEDSVRSVLRDMMERVRRTWLVYQQVQKKYLNQLKTLEFFKRAVARHLDEAAAARVNQQLQDFAGQVRETFDPETVLPADIVEDMKKNARMYREGDF